MPFNRKNMKNALLKPDFGSSVSSVSKSGEMDREMVQNGQNTTKIVENNHE